ncbi:MAG: chorismate mutase [Euryarchaeota archaeon]|nr:chorismate mutase [Euryarchaeota archaeon]
MSSLDTHRRQVREVDRRMVELMARRIKIAGYIYHAKERQGRPIRDPVQERRVLAEAESAARRLGLDPRRVRRVFRELIEMSVEHQRRLEKRERKPPRG